MTKKHQTSKEADEKVVKNIRRKARKTYSAEKMFRLVLAGLLGKQSTSVMCRQEGIANSRGFNLPAQQACYAVRIADLAS